MSSEEPLAAPPAAPSPRGRAARPPRDSDARAARLRDHALLLLAFAASRALLHAVGLRFKLDLAWMFLADPSDLRERFFETVYYFHAFAPGMNVITGLLSKLDAERLAESAQLVFWISGWVLLASVYEIMRRLRFSSLPSLAVALAVSLLPQSLYFENLYLYTYLCTAGLSFGAVLFHRALGVGTALAWFCFFLVCAVLGWLYTTFHITWFALMFAGALLLASPGTRRRVLAGAVLPALLIGALYTKNFAVFGVFGATSWGGANLTLATTQRMEKGLRDAWIAQGKLTPFAAISVFAPPSEYVRLLPELPSYPWPGTNDLWRPSVRAGNYNHGLFLHVNEQRRKDATSFIRERPLDYLKTVFGVNIPTLFHSSTHWHPADRRPTGAHYEHRQALGGYERWYDQLVHGWPANRAGLYVFFPLFYLWALGCVWRRMRHRFGERSPADALFAFGVLQIGFIVSASAAFSGLESARYRYTVEPFIWVMVASGLRAARHRVRSSLGPDLSRTSLGVTSGPSAS